MTTSVTTDPRRNIVAAMRYIRKYQHFPDCPCYQHRDSRGEGFCSYGHATWSRALDALIDQCRDR